MFYVEWLTKSPIVRDESQHRKTACASWNTVIPTRCNLNIWAGKIEELRRTGSVKKTLLLGNTAVFQL